jgi:hypothetical protein
MDNNQNYQNSIRQKLEEFRARQSMIDKKYSTNEAFQRYKEELNAGGKIVGKVTGRKRGIPKVAAGTGERKLSKAVENYTRFVKMLPVIPEYYKGHDINLVKFCLYQYLKFSGYDFVINEFKYQGSIFDTFAVQSNRGVEFEIKLSRVDYLKDFNKMFFIGQNVNKHSVLAAGQSPLISKFWFVVPENMIDVRECPAHAGLIWFANEPGGTLSFRVIKYPPLLHKNFVPALAYKTIANRLYVRYQTLLQRYSHATFLQQFNRAYNENRNDTAAVTHNIIPGIPADAGASREEGGARDQEEGTAGSFEGVDHPDTP